MKTTVLPRRDAIKLLGGLLLPTLPDYPASCADARTYRDVLPTSPRVRYGLNADWRFLKSDAPGAESPDFDDSMWMPVGLPHTFNDVDTFDEITKGGEAHEFSGIVWYRKRFTLPATAPVKSKVFLHLEGLKQAGRFYLNGKYVGLHENGVTECGIDLTDAVRYSGQENVLAVRVNSDQHYVEEATGVSFEWMSHDFNPNFGGLNHNAYLHVTGPVYQTLPLYTNLGTTGTYIYPTEIDVPGRRAAINVESQVANASAEPKRVTLSAIIVDADGKICATLPAAPAVTIAPGQTAMLSTRGPLNAVRLWSDQDPYLYRVYSVLRVDGQVVDVVPIETGFRKTAFKGGAGKGGVWINDRWVYCRGYAQRSTNEWAGLGQAYPDWMHDYHARLVTGSHANYIRWMHITPCPADVRACDRAGIIQICPAGDKERDATGRQWEQRLEVMRASMISLRNHPSILFWEAGNNGISGEHMKQMRDLWTQWDPHGGRVIGCRSISDETAVEHAGYYGTMISEDPRLFEKRAYTAMFRGYSDERRDRGPLMEAEDFRDEAARRFWDPQSPPHFGFHKQPTDTWDYDSESFCIAAVKRYGAYWSERISNTDPAHAKWSGYASIIFADTNSHGRQYASEVCRVSGKVDAVRLPKQAYFTYRVMQSPTPDLHLIGHWTYPAGTKKTLYVVANCPVVELWVNGKQVGRSSTPTHGFLFAFPDIAFEPGTIRAVGIAANSKPVCEMTLETAGAPHRLRLTPIVGPGGLRADGSDVALIDFEVVDAQGRRCPTDEARVDFDLSGPAIWRGGYNSGVPGSTNNLYLLTECGINRIAVRATRAPGTIVLTARRSGLTSATLRLDSRSVTITWGLG